MCSLYILYGSQTGCAEDAARRILRQAKRRHIATILCAMDEFSFTSELSHGKHLIFVLSTSGQGDFPDNASSFWRFLLKKSLPENFLASINFTILGLGDSSYQKFNFAAKKLHRRLLQLSANLFHEVGLADDQHEFGCNSVVDSWINNLWLSLKNVINFDDTNLAEDALPPSFNLIYDANLADYQISSWQACSMLIGTRIFGSFYL